jgi:hypothetical protein
MPCPSCIFWLIFHWFSLLFGKSGCFLLYQLNSYLLGKVFTHTHAHCMRWVIYLKFLSAGKFVLIEYLTFIYIFTYFCNAIWLFYQFIIHACSEANFWEKYFSANFPPVSDFQCEASGWTYSYIQTSAVLPYADLAVVIRMVKWHIRTGSLQL